MILRAECAPAPQKLDRMECAAAGAVQATLAFACDASLFLSKLVLTHLLFNSEHVFQKISLLFILFTEYVFSKKIFFSPNQTKQGLSGWMAKSHADGHAAVRRFEQSLILILYPLPRKEGDADMVDERIKESMGHQVFDHTY